MSTQRASYDDSNAPKENLDTWEPLTSEAEAITGAETPEIIELPPPAPTPASGLHSGDVLADRYELVALITDGAIGPIYEIFDRFIRNREALCILPQDVSGVRSQRRLTRGIEAAKAVRHTGVAALFDLGEDPERNLRFVTMEKVDGTPLAQVLRERNGSLPVWDSLDISRQISEALAAAHRRVEHFCLNPGNIILLPDGSVKILELGLADALPRETVLAQAAAQGTDAYLAPELRNRFMDGDARADVYSLGVVLYEMLTGHLPEEEPLAPSEEVRGISPAIDGLVLHCLRRRAEERPRNIRGVERILRRELQPRKGYLPLWVAAAASFALVCAAIFFLRPDSSGAETPPVILAKTTQQAPAPLPVAPDPPAPTPPPAAQEPRPPKPAPAKVEPLMKPVPPPTKPPKREPEVMAAVPPPTVTKPAADTLPPAPQAIRTEPIGPRRVLVSERPASNGEPEVEVLDDLPAVPPTPTASPMEVPAPTIEQQPQTRSTRSAALRAQREAQSIQADRHAPADFEAATAALKEGDTWNDAGWTEEADQQYHKAEEHFRAAIRQSLRPIDAQGPIVAAPAPGVSPQDLPPATRSGAPAHSLVFVQIIPARDGTLDRAEFAFNLLGGGQRRQTFSLGEEVADGWRLDSINATNQTVRLRSGSQVVSLAPSATQRTPAPHEARLP